MIKIKIMRTFRGSTASLAVGLGLGAAVLPYGAYAQVGGAGQGPAQQSGSSANAQVTDGGLVDIVVTAQRRAERSQDVPVAVVALDAQSLEQRNIQNLQGLSAAVPGLGFQSLGFVVLPFLRGVGSNATGAGNESPVATFVDGVYVGSQTSGMMSLNNIANIEVDKGPQGTLFGRNATGGVIQITTKDPSFDPAMDARLGYANYDTVTASLYATSGIVDDLVRGDIAVYYRKQHDGWGTNNFNGQDINKGQSLAIRSKLVFDLSADTKLTFQGDYSRERTDNGIVFGQGKQGAFMAAGSPKVYQYEGFYNSNSDNPSLTTNTNVGVSAKIEHDLSWARLLSVTAYRVAKGTEQIDGDITGASLIAANIILREKSFSQELQLASPDATSRFQWQVGTFFYHNDGDYPEFTIFGTAPNSPFQIPQDIEGRMKTRSIAGYAHMSYEIFDRTRLIVGFRYTSDRRTASGRTCGGPAQLFSPTPTVPVCVEYTQGPGGAVGSWAVTQSSPTWDVTLDRKLSDDVLVYAKYARGFKSGLFNLAQTNTPPVSPEKLDSYELGMKSEWFNHRLRVNVSAFWYDYTNLQVQRYQSGTFLIQNAAASRIRGVDVDVQARIGGGFSLSGNFEYLDAKYTSYPDGQRYSFLPLTQLNFPFGFGGMSVSPADLSGNRMILAPKISSALNFNYTTAVSFGTLDFGVNGAYRSRSYFDAGNVASQSPFATLGASAKWTSNDDRLTARIWGNNLTGKQYYNSLTANGTGLQNVPAPPRTYGIEFGVKF